MVNGKWTAFILCCSNQWPLRVLYIFALHSPTHTHIHPFIHIHTPTVCQLCKATASSSGAFRVRYLAQGHLDTQTLRHSDTRRN